MSSHSFNLSKIFPSSPEPSDQPLPFAIDEMDFSVWHNALPALDDMAKCQQVLQVLQTLNKGYPPESRLIPAGTYLFILEKLGSVLTAATAMLTVFPNITDQTSSTTAEETARSEISVWSHLELGTSYLQICQDGKFAGDELYTNEEKTQILTNGILAMGKVLLYSAQTYAKPNVFFWHKCYQFYRIGQLNGLTDSELNPGTRIIENAFKRLLVFSLCNTNQFSPSEMRTIYELLGHYSVNAGLLKAVPKKKFKGIPSLHLQGNAPPTITAEEDSDTPDPDRLYIATVIVASKILEATYDKRTKYAPTDRLMLLRLAKTLTLNEQRKDSRETAEGNHLGIMSFDNIVEFLRSKEIEQQNLLAEIGYFDPSRPGELRDLNFEIVASDLKKTNEKSPAPAFQVVEFIDPSDIWKGDARENQLETNMRLVDKSTKGFGLLWTDDVIKPKVGSIIGIMHKKMTIGLIRWLVQSKETGMFMGVELMGSNATVVKVSNPGYPDTQVFAILLPGVEVTKQPASLILMNKEFRPSEFIFIHKNHRTVRYRLTKQLNITSFINHVELVRSH
jgi:hypothetical protein